MKNYICLNNFKRAITWLTIILTLCAAAMRVLGVYSGFNTISAAVLGLFCFLAYFKDNKIGSSDNIFTATLFIGDMLYVGSLSFLLGRSFIAGL